MNKFILDIGGTNIEYKVLTDKDDVRDSFPVDGMNKDKLLEKIATLIDSYNKDEFYVGISSPTAVDTKTGFCNGMSGIKDYENFNLYEELQAKAKTKLNIKAMNDGKASLLGLINRNFPNEKPNSAVMIALGTGIGGALYIDGKIFPGLDNMAGELGYPVWRNGDNISINLSPVNVFKREFKGMSGKDIFNNLSDPIVAKKINDWFKDLSRFLSMLSFFINPEMIVFHGGVTHNRKFQDGLSDAYEEYKKENGFSGLINTKLVFFNDECNYGIIGAEGLLDGH